MNVKKDKFEHWSAEDSATLYGINDWGAGYFHVNEKGELTISPSPDKNAAAVSLPDIVHGILERGMNMPVLIRVSNILESRINQLHASFRKAIEQTKYKGQYKGVFPIKVNQQQQVVEDISRFGKEFHHGLEAGSKAELIAALGTLHDPEAYVVCNGYKDEEFIDLALYASMLGFQCILVIEMPSELDVIIERSRMLKVKPMIGVRM